MERTTKTRTASKMKRYELSSRDTKMSSLSVSSLAVKWNERGEKFVILSEGHHHHHVKTSWSDRQVNIGKQEKDVSQEASILSSVAWNSLRELKRCFIGLNFVVSLYLCLKSSIFSVLYRLRLWTRVISLSHGQVDKFIIQASLSLFLQTHLQRF